MSSTYTTITGDTWDLIAYKVYGNESYMTTLLEANQNYLDTIIFKGGIELTCPDIETETVESTAPWR